MEIWATETADAMQFACNMQNRVNRSYEKNMKVGDTLHIPTTSNIAAQTKSAATNVTWEDPTEAATDISVQTYEYAGFLIENMMEAQANQDVRGKYTQKLGYGLSRSREVALGVLIASFTQSVGSDNVELTASDYRTARKYLAQAGIFEDAKVSDNVSIFVTPAVDADNLAIDEFANRDYNANANVIGAASTGSIYGIKPFVSNLLYLNSSGYYNAMFHRDAIALVVQKEVDVVSQFLIDSIADGVLAWNIYGCGLVKFQLETPRTTSTGTTTNYQFGVKLLGK